MLEAILAGGQEAVSEAGALLVGGHSVRDKELKFGMSVTGVVHPERCWTNAGAKPGDCLIFDSHEPHCLEKPALARSARPRNFFCRIWR